MAILRWDPYKDLSLMQERLNQFFKADSPAGEENGGTFFPPVDILETQSEVILRAELPGVDKEDIDIQIEGDSLVLKGERRFEKEVGQENYFRMECSYGTFRRAFTLPSSIIKDEVNASFDQGVLEIRLPKEIRENQIQVKVD